MTDDDLLAGSYRLGPILGQGQMGTVYAAEHVRLRKRVVVKIIKESCAKSAADRMRLEAQAVAALDHPSIVSAFDFGTTRDGSSFFVMERLEGRSFSQEVRARGALPVLEAIRLIRGVLAGLAEAHRIGIVHRDLSPSNLFRCSNGLAKILDFGIAKILPSADVTKAPSPLKLPTEDGAIVGSPRYLSSEQARGAPVDARSDLYTVGAVLYLLVTGRDPFHDIPRGNVVHLLMAHVKTVPPPPSSVASQQVPASLDRIVMKALAKSPSARPASAAELCAELARVEVELTRPLVALTPPPEPARRWERTEQMAIDDFAKLAAPTEQLSRDAIAAIEATGTDEAEGSTVRLPRPEVSGVDRSRWEQPPEAPPERVPFEPGTLIQLRTHKTVFLVVTIVVLCALAILLLRSER